MTDRLLKADPKTTQSSLLGHYICNGIEMWTGPLACLSLSSVDVVDKDQDSQSGIGSLLFLLPRCKSKLEELKDQDM